MRLVVIESPFAGDRVRNLRYLRACMRDCLLRGEAPYASHALYTQDGVLDDDVAEQRALGIAAGFAWRRRAEMTCFYVDLGWSNGMMGAKSEAVRDGLAFEERTLADWEGEVV